MLTSFSRCLKNVSLKCVSSSQKAFCSFLVVQEIFFPQRFVCSNDDCAASAGPRLLWALSCAFPCHFLFLILQQRAICSANAVLWLPVPRHYERQHPAKAPLSLATATTRRLEHKRSGVQPLVIAVQLIHHMVWSMLMRRSAFSSLHCLCNSAWCRSPST